MNPVRALLLTGLALLAALPAAADEETARVREQQLEAVRERISELKLSMDRATRERDRLTAELQAAEVSISEKRLRLKDLERERDFAERRRRELEASIAEREAELDEESALLAAQLRAAWMSGRQERLQLLLSQNDPAALGRTLAWYAYLNDYRADNIDAVSSRIRELVSLASEVRAEEARLEQIAAERYAELGRLNAAQEERQSLLAALRERMREEGEEIERLAVEERELARLIAELQSILSDYPISAEEPFSAWRGRLTWPVAGSLLHEFGQPRAGGVKWNGVVLGAPRGEEVRAVYHGRVAFADWLAGLGLLVIVDHGDGYLSLYGYNETLLTSPGDWVAPGDVIATVGDSGGQARPGLYFEIRRGTAPENPRRWVTRQPGN